MSTLSAGIKFDRLIGPHADTKELEYISALHQTEHFNLRKDGTLKATDIVHYLASRHGIRVEEEVVKEKIVYEFCGSLFQQDSIDLCQIVTLLIIPYLKRMKDRSCNPSRRNETTADEKESESTVLHSALDLIFKIILSEAKAIDQGAIIHTTSSDDKIILTPKLLTSMLENCGEDDIAPQDIIEMIQAVKISSSTNSNIENGSEIVVLDKASFLKVLTEDVSLYSPGWEEMDTTFYEDSKCIKPTTTSNEIEEEEAGQQPTYEQLKNQNQNLYENQEEVVQQQRRNNASKPKKHTLVPSGTFFDRTSTDLNNATFTKFMSSSFVDLTSDTYRSPLLVVLLWTNLLINFHFRTLDDVTQSWSADCGNDFQCRILSSIVQWIFFCVLLIVTGLFIVVLGSLGNTPYNPTQKGGKICLSVFVIISVLFTFVNLRGNVSTYGEIFLWSDDVIGIKSEDKLSSTLLVIVSALILGERIIRLYQIWNARSIPYLTGGTMVLEKFNKQAATNKVEILIRNALLMHYKPNENKQNQDSDGSIPNSLFTAAVALHEDRDKHSHMMRAFLNYEAMSDVTERIGGFIWTWKKILDGSLFHKEGIWLHARLISSNVAQILALAFNILMFARIFSMKHSVYEKGWIRESLFTENDLYATEIASAARQMSGGFSNNNNATQRNFSYVTGPVFYIPTGQKTLSIDDVFTTLGVPKELVTGMADELLGKFDLEGFGNSSSILSGLDLQYTFNGYFIELSTQNMFLNSTDDYPAVFVNSTSYVPLPLSGTFYYNNDTESFNYKQLSVERVADIIKDILPPWQVAVPISVGCFLGIIVCIIIILVFIPSAVSTIIKYRSGNLISLRDPRFVEFRLCKDHCALLFGSAFWGCMFAGWFTFVIFSIVVFFFVWEGTRSFALNIIAQLIGITVTFLIRICFLLLFRKRFSSGGFYISRPGAMNIVGVCLEFWNLALTVGYMTVRALHLFVVVIIYIGRVDTPILAPRAGDIGPVKLDITPTVFKKDLLLHDAHRHPYIERLGLMYLMKLRHGEKFGNKVGTYWRMLLVLTLMPWMQNYRTWAYSNVEQEQTDFVSADVVDQQDDNEKNNFPSSSGLMSVVSTSKQDYQAMIKFDKRSTLRKVAASRRLMSSHRNLEAQNKNLIDLLEELAQPSSEGCNAETELEKKNEKLRAIVNEYTKGDLR